MKTYLDTYDYVKVMIRRGEFTREMFMQIE